MAVNPTHVEGKNVGNVRMYALSTCIWCRKTKRLLSDLGIEYSYIDVDLLQGEDKGTVLQEVARWNPSRSFPTVVINDEVVVIGFDESKLREQLEK